MIRRMMIDCLKLACKPVMTLTLTLMVRSYPKVQIIANVQTLGTNYPEELADQMKANSHMESRCSINFSEFYGSLKFPFSLAFQFHILGSIPHIFECGTLLWAVLDLLNMIKNHILANVFIVLL